MKKILYSLVMILLFHPALAQDNDSLAAKPGWDGSISLYGYFFSDDFMMLPVVQVNKGNLHLEARYNYESEKTGSFWAGYNFSGGSKFEYTITPMAGLVVGEIDGIAPGLEMTYSFWKLELYTESEYFLEFKHDANEESDDFFYNWTDLTFSINDNFWFGLSGQRSRNVESELEIQRGLFLGGGAGSFEFSGYAYNFTGDEAYFIAGITYVF